MNFLPLLLTGVSLTEVIASSITVVMGTTLNFFLDGRQGLAHRCQIPSILQFVLSLQLEPYSQLLPFDVYLSVRLCCWMEGPGPEDLQGDLG